MTEMKQKFNYLGTYKIQLSNVMSFYIKKEYYVYFLQNYGLCSDLCLEWACVAERDCEVALEDQKKLIRFLREFTKPVDPFD